MWASTSCLLLCLLLPPNMRTSAILRQWFSPAPSLEISFSHIVLMSLESGFKNHFSSSTCPLELDYPLHMSSRSLIQQVLKSSFPPSRNPCLNQWHHFSNTLPSQPWNVSCLSSAFPRTCVLFDSSFAIFTHITSSPSPLHPRAFTWAISPNFHLHFSKLWFSFKSQTHLPLPWHFYLMSTSAVMLSPSSNHH